MKCLQTSVHFISQNSEGVKCENQFVHHIGCHYMQQTTCHSFGVLNNLGSRLAINITLTEFVDFHHTN